MEKYKNVDYESGFIDLENMRKMEEDAESVMEELEGLDEEELIALAEAMNADGSDLLHPEEPVKQYTSAEDRYQDMNSSAVTFLFLGGLGVVLIILCMAGILNIPFLGTGIQYSTIVMGVVFLIFFLVGVHSYISAKKIAPQVQAEKDFIQQLMDWFETQYPANKLNSRFSEELSPEELFFQRNTAIKGLVSAQYPDLEDAFLEKIAEDIYQRYFEQ